MTPMDGLEPEAKTKKTKHNAADNLCVREQTPVNINAYKVDLSEAHIYKYVIEFSPVDYFSRKEKETLARGLLGKVGIAFDLDAVDIVFGDNFEFFLPHPNAQLSQRCLHASFYRSDSPKGDFGSIESFAPGGSLPVYSNFFLSPDLCDEGFPSDFAISVPRIFEGLKHCKVSARGPEFNLKSLLTSKDSGSKDIILAALTKLFQSIATPMVRRHSQVKAGAVEGLREMGSKVFDFWELPNEEPVHVAGGIEVRRGIKASTRIIGGSIFRVVSPTSGMFFKAGTNLAEQVVWLLGMYSETGQSKAWPAQEALERNDNYQDLWQNAHQADRGLGRGTPRSRVRLGGTWSL
jgi:hypothetical protein